MPFLRCGEKSNNQYSNLSGNKRDLPGALDEHGLIEKMNLNAIQVSGERRESLSINTSCLRHNTYQCFG